jgi:hypothetical protein
MFRTALERLDPGIPIVDDLVPLVTYLQPRARQMQLGTAMPEIALRPCELRMLGVAERVLPYIPMSHL